jgi:hypothetical protein
MKFIINLPIIEHKSAGVRCLLRLNDLLNLAGYHCELNSPPGPKDIAIYPDIIRGNPWGASRVVRYMLYYTHLYFGGDRISASDCVIVYADLFFKDMMEHYDGKLTRANIVTIPCMEAGLFFPEEKTIDSVCYIGKPTATCVPPKDMPVITRESMSREECAKLLRTTRNLYSLDHHSAILGEGLICGCKCWIVHDDGTKHEFYHPDPESQLQDDARDVVTARRFAQIAIDFFANR